MTSRDDILAAIRRQRAPTSPLPAEYPPGITFPDRLRQFCDVLAFVGGEGLPVESAALRPRLEALRDALGARHIVCRVPGLEDLASVDLDSVADPAALESLDLAILPGALAVAENAAVWCPGAGLKHRAVYFLPQHLALVVPQSRLVDNLHQAYEELRFPEASYGLFISGPSKTADIEQSLVIGAHGPRSLTVFLTAD